jgi:CNT family concentrative nucleoside transporter
MCDWLVGSAGMLLGFADPNGNPIWSLSAMMSYLFWPFAWLMGIATDDCLEAGRLLGIKMVTNEFIAYEELGQLLRADGGPKISERTARIMTYALCGFANFSSIGIQVGGIGGLAPDRKNDLAKLGLRAMIGGTIACLMTGCFAGIFIA